MQEDAFDTLMSSLDPPLVVVTTAADGEQAGCLLGFHTQSSISAQQYSFWVSKANHTYVVSLRSSHFGIHFLSADDAAWAEHFGAQSGDDHDKFAAIQLEDNGGNPPLIKALPNRLVVERIAMLDDRGDHACVTAKVVAAASAGSFTPLRLSDVTHLRPGHASEERAVDPSGKHRS